MGRQKNVPIKSKRTGEIWSAHNYVPVFKKRKNRRKKSDISCSYIVTASNEENEQFLIGSMLIGKTNNIFPNNYSQCRISFKRSEDEKEPDTFILDCDQTLILIRSTIDAIFLKEIVTSKVFALDFVSDGEDVLLNIYFLVLPLPKFYQKIGKCLKTIFELLYKIGTDTAKYVKSELQGNSEILNIYRKLSLMRENRFKRLNLQHQMLKPNLRLYQQDAVQWMLYREQMSLIESDMLHPLYTSVKLILGQEVYFDRFAGFITNIKPVVSSCSKGGILADEMGLGKTVEVLACILLNPQEPETFLLKDSGQSPVIDKPKRKRKLIQDTNEITELTLIDSSRNIKVPRNWVKSSSKKSDNKIALELWYNHILSSTSTVRKPVEDPDEPLIQCVCGSRAEDGLIECESCGKYQHRSCLGYNKSLGKYYCPQCWMDEPLIDCGATLIVTPISLRTQWCKEICKHIKGNLKVLRYEGYNTSPIYPTQLKQYDIVITTYNVLQNELKLTENGQVLNLRRERKYSPPGCPLVRIKWWRLCLDEAQAVEAPGRMISEMAKRIQAHYRWAVTGTPISKNISDIFGLIDYLQITPYNDFDTWKNVLYEPYTRGDEKPLLNFLSEVLWRNSKIDVADQINIPKQTFKEHILEFSAVEKYFYKREHELCRLNFLATVEKYDSNLLLERLDKGTLKTILAPLLTLRHTCTQPNTVKGRFMATKKQVTSMKELLDALILKNISDSEECLRLIISSLNGLAGVQLLLQSPHKAIKHYRQVLQLLMRFTEEKNNTKLTVDKLQVVHAMHNLAETLETHPPEQPTLRDEFLRKDCMEMEQKYMNKFENQTVLAYESSKTSSDQVEKLQGNFVLKYGQWYSDGLDCVLIHNHFDEFLEKIHNTCENANITCNLRSTSQLNILQILYSWDEEIFGLRSKLFNSLDDLYETDSEHDNKLVIKACLVEKAMDCHLRPQKKSSKSVTKCPVCIANDKLKLYEGRLFDMVKRKKTFEDMALVGAWKPTMEELIFKVLHQLLKVKCYNPEFVKDGETYVALLEMLKKEFREIRKFWTFLDQQVCAQDELDICKVRLQLREMHYNTGRKMNKVMKNLTYDMENKHEGVNLLSVDELDYQHSVLNSELRLNNKNLDKLLGTQSYLETLRRQQYEGQSPDPCPICKNTLEQHWSILLCGHCYCLDCIQVLFEKVASDYIQCSVCRNRQIIQDISYIKAGNTVTDEDTNIIKGNFSTKIEAVVKLLIDLKSQNPDVKVLLFSSWITVLKSLEKALETNAVTCELAQSNNLEVRIENFKNPSNAVTALLLPINLGSKGLNLIEATHVVLVEPPLNPADELQAIGRVHRIGQTKPTVVHRFLIKNTIEESIYQATSSNAANWDKNKVTLQCLIDLFKMSDIKQEDNEPQHENLIPLE